MAVSTLRKDYAGKGKAQLYRVVHYKFIIHMCREMSLTFFFGLLFQTGLLIVHRPTAVRTGAEA